MWGVQVKLQDSFGMCAISEHLRGVFMTRHYKNPCLSYLTLPHKRLHFVGGYDCHRVTAQLASHRTTAVAQTGKNANVYVLSFY